MLAALGEASWLIAEHEANRQAVDLDLREAARLQRLSQWSEAHTALERARARLGDRRSTDLRGLLDQADRDQTAAARFDQDSLRSSCQRMEGVSTAHAPSPNTNRCFAPAGSASRGDDPALVASRIERSNIQGILVSAVEDWAAITEDEAYLDWLLQVARQAHPIRPVGASAH